VGKKKKSSAVNGSKVWGVDERAAQPGRRRKKVPLCAGGTGKGGGLWVSTNLNLLVKRGTLENLEKIPEEQSRK